MKKIFLFLLCLCTFVFADINKHFPELIGRVVDNAKLLDSQTKYFLEKELKNHEEKTSNQIVVVTLQNLKTYSIEEFSHALGNYWGIGQKDKNNGVLLIIAKDERKIRIEVGSGLEKSLSNKITKEIIKLNIKPHFKNDNYNEGIKEAISKIIDVIKGEYTNEKTNKEDQFFTLMYIYFSLIFIGVFISTFVKNIFSKICDSISIAAFGAFIGTAILVEAGVEKLLLYSILSYLAVFLISLFISSNKKLSAKFNIIFYGSRTSTSSFSSSSFSGGGGSFGGGGASGSW